MGDIVNANKNKNFDAQKFNKEFVFKKEEAKIQNRIKDQKKLDYLNDRANSTRPPLYKLNLSELLIGIKDTWFGILDDLLAWNINSKILTKRNRLFFIGLTLIIFSVILYLYLFFLEEKKDNNDKNMIEKPQIIEKHYIYNQSNTQNKSSPENIFDPSKNKTTLNPDNIASKNIINETPITSLDMTQK